MTFGLRTYFNYSIKWARFFNKERVFFIQGKDKCCCINCLHQLFKKLYNQYSSQKGTNVDLTTFVPFHSVTKLLLGNVIAYLCIFYKLLFNLSTCLFKCNYSQSISHILILIKCQDDTCIVI